MLLHIWLYWIILVIALLPLSSNEGASANLVWTYVIQHLLKPLAKLNLVIGSHHSEGMVHLK